MKIDVQLLLTFEQAIGQGRNPYTLELAPGSTVADLVSSLPIPQNAPKVVLVNGRLPRDEQVLKEGDRLTVFPPLEGG
ncbi:MAG: molybdopterin synthase sulfur carrier subunit [Desulfobacterales bacterium]|nr:MAG: molybdopterin synthase sulfur carrier subunit [Desulfobacterales bacterium]